MKILKTLKLFFSIVLLAILFSCNDSESNTIKAGDPTISVRLVDAPGDYKAVNVEIIDVMIKMDDDSTDDNGWISLEANDETVNLLDFTDGFSKVLVDRFTIPAGTLSQMRLVLGDGNTIVIENDAEEDVEYDLKTPSAQQSGLKLKVNSTIEEGFAYDYVLDFDVDKSIVKAGNSGNIILKPVLYVSAEVNSGIIQGTITPNDLPAIASVLVDDNGTPETEDDFVISAYTNETTGGFALWGVPAGTYDVIITPVDAESDYNETIVNDVIVVNGETTTIDAPIEVLQKPGSISGKILNEGVAVTASIMLDSVLIEVNTSTEGTFSFQDIPVGIYSVTLTPETGSTLKVLEIADVIVEANKETVLADVTLLE